MSISRAVLLWFPTFVLLGEFAERAGRGRGLLGTLSRGVVANLIGISSVVMLVWAWLYFRGDWAS